MYRLLTQKIKGVQKPNLYELFFRTRVTGMPTLTLKGQRSKVMVRVDGLPHNMSAVGWHFFWLL